MIETWDSQSLQLEGTKLAAPRDEEKQGSWGPQGGRRPRPEEGVTALCSGGSAWRAGDVESSGAEAGPGGLGNLFLTLRMSATRAL